MRGFAGIAIVAITGTLLLGCESNQTTTEASVRPAELETSTSTSTGTTTVTFTAPASTDAIGPVDERDRQRAAEYAAAIEGLSFDDGRLTVDALSYDLAASHEALGDGEEALMRNQASLAIGGFGRAVRLAPDQVHAYRRLAYALTTKGKLEEAAAVYRTAILLDPDDQDSRYRLATALAGLGDLDAAIAELETALTLQPDNGAAHERLAIWAYYQGDLERSREHVAEAERLGQPVPPQFLPLLEKAEAAGR